MPWTEPRAYTLLMSTTRWTVDVRTSCGQRPSDWDKRAFPARTNPNHPRPTGEPEKLPGRSESRRYPESCNPSSGKPPLDETQQGLATRYLPMARAMAHGMRRAGSCSRLEEFESTAYLALVEAAQSFDPSRNVNFATYARLRIRGALLNLQREMHFGGWRGDRTLVPTFQRLGPGAEEYGSVLGTESDEPVGADLELIDIIEHWIKQLPRLHAQAFRHIYRDGKSREEAAALVGCSKAHLSRLHHEAITWINQAERFACAAG